MLSKCFRRILRLSCITFYEALPGGVTSFSMTKQDPNQNPALQSRIASRRKQSDVSAEQVLAKYQPSGNQAVCTPEEWAEIGGFVRRTVGKVPDLPAAEARRSATVVSSFAAWAYRSGFDLVESEIFTDAALDGWLGSLGIDGPRCATYRWVLRRVSAAHGVSLTESSVVFGRAAYHLPFSWDEVDALLHVGRSLSNRLRGVAIEAAVLLGAGAGVVREELRGVCNFHVHEHCGDLFVFTDSRCSPVLPRFAADLRALIAVVPDGPLLGSLASSDNIADKLYSWVGEPVGVPRLRSDRLRAAYVCELIRSDLSVSELLTATGLKSAGSLDPYLVNFDSGVSMCEQFDA